MNCRLCTKTIEKREAGSSGFSSVIGGPPGAWNCAVCGRDFCHDCFTQWHKGEDLSSSLDRMKLEVCSDACFRRGSDSAPRLP